MASYEAVPHTEKLRKGSWHEEEDEQLIMCVTHLGERRWDYIARKSGLNRSGKSCRLRWLNYLRPNIKHGDISIEEEEVIIQLHEQWGNKWSRIARRLPGRTDNEIKNYWRTHLKRKIEAKKQESSQSGINHLTQDYSIPKVAVKGQRYDSDNRKCGENNFESSNALFDAVEFSDSVFTSSPYEVRMLDWMAELSDNQSTSGHSDELSCTESCYCFKEMICEDNDETWGWSGSIWDMN